MSTTTLAPPAEPGLFDEPVLVAADELALLRRKVAAAELFAELLVHRRVAGRNNVPARELAYLRAILENG